MSILDLEQVLEHELQLLNAPGPSLSDFYRQENEARMFVGLEAAKVSISKMVSSPRVSLNPQNGVFYSLTLTLMKVLFGKNGSELLQHLKCTLYSPTISISHVTNCSAEKVPDEVRKKILVEFFQVLQYNTGDLEAVFMKYPFAVLNFIFLLRTILKGLRVPGALDFSKRIGSAAAITKILDYFDVGYYCRKGIYIIEEEQIGIYVDPRTDQVFCGGIRQHSDQDEDSSFNFSH